MVTSPVDKYLKVLGKGKRLHELTLQEVNQMLIWFSALIGIPANNLPQQEVMVAIMQGLVRNFGSMYEPEVRLAFEMAATDKLEVEGHFQTFSLKYIASVLNAFRVQVNKEMNFHTRRAVPTTKELPSTPADWSECLSYIKYEISQGRSPIIPATMYDWMVTQGMINPTKEEKIAAMNKAHNRMKAELHSRIMNKPSGTDREEWQQINQKYSKNDPIYSKVSNEAKKVLVFLYLSNNEKTTDIATTAAKDTDCVQ